ncbi:MAG: hypothetical protein V1794_13635 [Candidatus Glassbacteria bacterium]
MRTIIFLTAFLFAAGPSSGQSLGNAAARRFVRQLAENSDSLTFWPHPDELARSRRLGISYEGVKHKFLIGCGLEPAQARAVLAGRYELKTENLGGGYSLVTLGLPEQNRERAFYFKDGRFITPVYYFSRNFKKITSDYFIFLVEDPNSFHPEAARSLDGFVTEAGTTLGVPEEDRQRLAREKIYYVLCRDQDRIEQLTGWRIRGMGVLSHDYVVSTYSCHYHEVVHLLVNYRLKNVPAVTHQLLREGIAVALGGRGGQDREVIADLGYYLMQSGLAAVDSLLDERCFLAQDASFSYPAAGLYTDFLLEKMGIGLFFDLYRTCSRGESEEGNPVISAALLPAETAWQAWLESYRQFTKVGAGDSAQAADTLFRDERAQVCDGGDRWLFRLTGELALGEMNPPAGYWSARFAETLPGAEYGGQRYLVSANPEEIAVYDLYTNNLIANRVASFTWPPETIPTENGLALFSLDKSLFTLTLKQTAFSLIKRKD